MPYTMLRTIEVGEHIYVEMMDQWLLSTEVQTIEKVTA